VWGAFMFSCGEAAESRDDIFFDEFLVTEWIARGLLAGGRQFFLDFGNFLIFFFRFLDFLFVVEEF
jgi:hypothetical protein